MPKSLRCTLLCLLFLTLSGCVSQAEDAGTKTITYEPALPPSLFFGGLIAGLFGWKTHKESRFGGILLVTCWIPVLLMAPSFYLMRATISDKRFEVTDGFWGSRTIQVAFDDITHVHLTADGRKNDHYWTYRLRSGEDVQLNIGNNVTDQAGLEIVARLKARGIHPEEAPPEE